MLVVVEVEVVGCFGISVSVLLIRVLETVGAGVGEDFVDLFVVAVDNIAVIRPNAVVLIILPFIENSEARNGVFLLFLIDWSVVVCDISWILGSNIN